MRVKKPQKVSKNERGSALVYTLMVLLLLSLLGLSVGMVTVGSYKLSDSNRDYTSAYYIAEAGATIAYEELKNQITSDVNNKLTKDKVKNRIVNYKMLSNKDFQSQHGEIPNAFVTIEELDSEKLEYRIVSRGEIGTSKRTVYKTFAINWPIEQEGKEFPNLPLNTALFVKEKMELLGGELMGEAYTNSVVNKTIKMGDYGSWKKATIFHSSLITSEKLLDYQDWFKPNLPIVKPTNNPLNFEVYEMLLNQLVPPKIDTKIEKKNNYNGIMVPDNQGNIKINNSNVNNITVDIDSNYYIPVIYTQSQWPLKLNVGNFDRVLMVDTLDLGGNLHVEGSGKLTIFVKNKLNVNSGGITINPNGNSSKLTIIYLGKESLSLGNNIKINGHFIVKEADLAISTIPINGIFLTGSKNVDLSGGVSNPNLLIIAPFGNVSMKGSYTIYGGVVSKNIKIDGDSKLFYKEISTEGFPLQNSQKEETPKLDLINSDPIIEPN